MAAKNNINDLFSKTSRYVAGGTTEATTNFIEHWEPFSFPLDESDKIYAVENEYQNRLDKISSAYYGDNRWWWFIAQYNNILDPFTEVTAGTLLRLPTIERLQLLIGTRQGGVSSTRQPVNTIKQIIQ